MAANYWLKLYHEMLDDPKVARLPDSSYRRFIECLLLAGEANEGGFLPPIEDMAWRLRISETGLGQDMSRLALAGIVELKQHTSGDRWFVTKFSERQAAVNGAERVKQHRKRNKKRTGNDNGNDGVTNSYTDTDTDTDTDTELELDTEPEKKAGAGASKPNHPVWELPENLKTPEFEAAWIAWFKHRLEKNRYLTQTSGETLLSQLSPLGPERAAAAILYSISRGWLNVYEPDPTPVNGQNGNGQNGRIRDRDEIIAAALAEVGEW